MNLILIHVNKKNRIQNFNYKVNKIEVFKLIIYIKQQQAFKIYLIKAKIPKSLKIPQAFPKKFLKNIIILCKLKNSKKNLYHNNNYEKNLNLGF
jgi:hypothetical protein